MDSSMRPFHMFIRGPVAIPSPADMFAVEEVREMVVRANQKYFIDMFLLLPPLSYLPLDM